MSSLRDLDWIEAALTTSRNIPRLLTEQFFNVAITVGTGQVTFLAGLLALQGFGIISIGFEASRWISLWTAANLFSVPILRRRMLSPRVANPTCNFCSSKGLAVTGLVCMNCGSEVLPPKDIKEMLGKKE